MIQPRGIWHEHGCSQPMPQRLTGRFGDELESCPECRRYAVLVGGMPPIPPPPERPSPGWPTHRHRRRNRSRRGTK